MTLFTKFETIYGKWHVKRWWWALYAKVLGPPQIMSTPDYVHADECHSDWSRRENAPSLKFPFYHVFNPQQKDVQIQRSSVKAVYEVQVKASIERPNSSPRSFFRRSHSRRQRRGCVLNLSFQQPTNRPSRCTTHKRSKCPQWRWLFTPSFNDSN
jgi:hypothetical protein